MRRALITLTLVATCGLVALGVAAAVTGKRTRDARGSASSGAPRAGADVGPRTWSVSMSPRAGDLALAEIGFNGAGRRRLSPRSLRVAVSGPFGDDYLASATPRALTSKGPTAFVLLVNRPSPLLDPVTVRLRITAPRALGAPVVRQLADPFTRSAGEPRPALCDLRGHGQALTGSQFNALGSRGTPLVGFAATSAVAQAYDVACGLPYASAFKQAVEGSPAPTGSSPSQPASPNPPAPTPAPPVARLPGEGCRPTPGRACPGAAAGRGADGARLPAGGAH